MASKLGDWIFPISTHAPLARCDAEAVGAGENAHHFNSRTSCEVRPIGATMTTITAIFQLTHLLRGATGASIENDGFGHFNSRTSCEVRR